MASTFQNIFNSSSTTNLTIFYPDLKPNQHYQFDHRSLDPKLCNSSVCSKDDLWTGTYRSILALLSIIIILVGTTGNTVTYFVLRQKSYKNNVMASALRYLSMMDIIILWTIVSRMVIKGVFRYDFSLLSPDFCMIYQGYVIIMLSSVNWHLVIITLTRLIHLKFPFKTQVICSKLNFYLLIIVTNLAIIVGHSGILLIQYYRGNINNEEIFSSCYVLSSRIIAMGVFGEKLNFTINFLIPAFLLIVFNLMICVELGKVEEREKLLKAKAKAYMTNISQKTSDVSNSKGNDQYVEGTTNETKNAVEYDLGGLMSSQESEVSTSFTTCRPALDLDFGNSEGATGSKLLNRHDHIFSNDWLLLEGERFRKHDNDNRFSDKKSVGKVYTKSWEVQIYSSPANVSQNAIEVQQSQSNSGAKMFPTSRQLQEVLPSEVNTADSSCTSIDQTLREPICLGKPSHDNSIDSNNEPQQELSYITSQLEDVNQSQAPQQPSKSKENIKCTRPKDTRVQSLTRLLIIANTVFLTLNIPYWGYHLFAEPWRCKSESICQRQWFVRNLLVLLRYSNHSLNFFFYCASGSRFRQEFLNVVEPLRKFLYGPESE